MTKNLFSQKAFVMIEVKTAKKERKTSKAGKDYDTYSLFGTTVTEGVAINIRKSVYNLNKEQPDFITNKIAGLENIIEKKANKQKVFAFVTVNPAKGKTGETIMYDKVSTYSTDAGKTGIVVEAWATEVPFEDTENGIIFNFKNSNKTKAECETMLEVDMLVVDKNENKISLIDKIDVDFPVQMDVWLKDGVANNAEIMQGYRFTIKFEKGKKNENVSEDMGWDEEAKTTFAPDILRVFRVGKIKDYVVKNEEDDGLAYNSKSLF